MNKNKFSIQLGTVLAIALVMTMVVTFVWNNMSCKAKSIELPG